MLEENKSRSELSDLGEFGLIKHLTDQIKLENKSSKKGVGDDAAVIGEGKEQTLISTDMLVEGVHFNLMYCPLKHLGYKAVVVNLSDIYAMNGRPEQITVSIAISNRFSLEAVEELYKGIYKACEIYNVDLVGGDTTSSSSGLILSITAIGKADKKDIVYRNTANEGDLLCVTGDLGSAYIGLQILEREKEVFKAAPQTQPDLEGHDYVLERQLKPEARKDVIQMFKQLNLLPTAMIDISDGLASEVLHICDSSGVGCNIYDHKIPIDPTTVTKAVDFNLDPTMCALNGGEDYELLFTIKQSDYDKIKGSPHFSPIGHLTDKNSGVNLVSQSGTVNPITAQGWDAFLGRNNS